MKALTYTLVIVVLTIISCKKDSGNNPGGSNAPKIPTLTTTKESAITSTSVESGGAITSDGGSPVTARGVCWNEFTSPTINDNKTSDGVGSGIFISKLTGLTPYNTYNVRAYATNAAGTAYGNKIVILTSPGVTITTSEVNDDNYQRTCETQIDINGFTSPNPPQVTESGVCWGKAQNPTISDSKISNGPVTAIYTHFNTTLPLSTNSTYYIRGYATTSTGTTIYGNQVTYTTGIDIGLSHEGGIIFYLDNTGQHGLIAASSNQGTAIPWAPENLFTTLTNATSTTDGASNTTKIINTYGNSGTYAAKLCRDYRGGGYSDWYLPSGDEIYRMENKQDVIGGFHGSAFLENYYYWCSTENNYFLAWGYDFNPRYFTVGTGEKRNLYYVRAIRAF